MVVHDKLSNIKFSVKEKSLYLQEVRHKNVFKPVNVFVDDMELEEETF